MMPSETRRMFSSSGMASARSILAIRPGLVVRRGGHVAQLARQFHVGGVLGEADGDIVGLQAHGGLDVLHVLGGQGRRGQTATLLVDALVVGEFAAELDGGVYGVADHLVHRHHNQAVVEQQDISGLHIPRQFLVVQAHTLEVAWLSTGCIEHEGHAWLQHHLALGELADPDLGPLQVGHDAHLPASAAGGLAHQVRPVDVVLRLAVREVQPHDVDAGTDHGFEDLGGTGCGAEGGNDLGSALGHEGVSVCNLVSIVPETGYRRVTDRVTATRQRPGISHAWQHAASVVAAFCHG